MTFEEILKKELAKAVRKTETLKAELKSTKQRVLYLKEQIKDEEYKTRGLSNFMQLSLDMFVSKIESGKTYEEAGYPRNGLARCAVYVVRHIDIQGWKSCQQFYKALPEHLKTKDIFTLTITSGEQIQFIPTEHRIAIIGK